MDRYGALPLISDALNNRDDNLPTKQCSRHTMSE